MASFFGKSGSNGKKNTSFFGSASIGQRNNTNGNYTPGTGQATMGGLPVSTSTPNGSFIVTKNGNVKYPTPTPTATPKSTVTPVTAYPTGPNAMSGTNNGTLPARYMEGEPQSAGTSGAKWDPNIFNGAILGSMVGAATLANGALQQTKKTGGGGGGGAAVDPAAGQLANNIAWAYGRMRGNGPDPYSDPYQAEIDAMRGRRYQDYESQYQPKIDGLVDRLLNREAFSYNWSDDPLYRQYAARYQQTARQGMQDTMGQAAALTGGYGSSYATTAGQQAYANQMAGLNDQAMQLYQLAKDRYDTEGADMRANLSALETREAQNRGNYDSDRASFYNREDADLANLQNSQALGYNMYRDDVQRDLNERELAWQMYQYWNNLFESQKK